MKKKLNDAIFISSLWEEINFFPVLRSTRVSWAVWLVAWLNAAWSPPWIPSGKRGAPVLLASRSPPTSTLLTFSGRKPEACWSAATKVRPETPPGLSWLCLTRWRSCCCWGGGRRWTKSGRQRVRAGRKLAYFRQHWWWDKDFTNIHVGILFSHFIQLIIYVLN